MNLTDAASSLPTESFTRAYQMRMPGSKVDKPESKDPLRSLMKAMKIDVKKSREKSTPDGTKSSAMLLVGAVKIDLLRTMITQITNGVGPPAGGRARRWRRRIMWTELSLEAPPAAR
eukprot:COSAG02_NODE_1013_length_15207_cov_4.700556_4_plen_117_part_00